MSQFYKDGTGDPNILQVYMKNSGVENISIVNIRWNRSNVLFHNAAGTFLCKNIFVGVFSLFDKISLLFRILLLYACNKKIFLTFLRSPSVVCKIIAEPYF